MDTDPLSPIAPARIKVLLLPLGRIRRSRFHGFVKRLALERSLRLGDISPDGRPNRTMFSPLAFPTGVLILDITTSSPPTSHLALSPFELWREPHIILGLMDSTELLREEKMMDSRESNREFIQEELSQASILLKEQHPKAMVHHTLLFDSEPGALYEPLPDGISPVPPTSTSKTTTIKTIMCDLASHVLAEMTTFAKSLQGLESVDSPKVSQTASAMNGNVYGSDRHNNPLRRNSQLATVQQGGISNKSVEEIRSQHRLSMPVHLPSSMSEQSRDISNERPTSPPSRDEEPPPTTFNQIASAPKSSNDSRKSMMNVKFPKAENPHQDHSRERVSVSGFGSGSLSERARNKGKGRIGVIIGTLYLLAGRWNDAIRELSESASIAKANSDHLWHGKSLENILVCILLLAWAGMDFQIPQVCYPITEKTSTKSPQHTPSDSQSDLNGSATTPKSVSLRNLAILIPDLLQTILNLYVRAANFQGEALPQLSFSEAVLRASKLLATMHISNSELNDEALEFVVMGKPIPRSAQTRISRWDIRPLRTEITGTLLRAYPNVSSDLSVTDHILILAGIASVFSLIGFERKKVVVLRELITVLIPGLVNARKVGAAEMGVHPAAGLAALGNISTDGSGAGALDLGESDVEVGIRDLLASIGGVYGIYSKPVATLPKKENGDNQDTSIDSDDAIIRSALEQVQLAAFGSPDMKASILRLCITVCEALPDFDGVLRLTSTLLRTAKGDPNSVSGGRPLARDEQIRLATNVSRTVSAGAKLGLANLEAEYWDDFLLSNIDLMELPMSKRPIEHAKSDLNVASQEILATKSPFIYNPFLKKSDIASAKRCLVAEEPAEFRATLTNPYDFELSIEKIELETSDSQFVSEGQRGIIAPNHSQVVSILGTPKSPGDLKISGCIIKVRGCRERRFPIFREVWRVQLDSKIKASGLESLKTIKQRPMSTLSAGSKAKHDQLKHPIPASFFLTVVETQPLLVVDKTSISQSAIMILEGETKTFTVTLRNLSTTLAIDFILLSFKDSTEEPLKTAMNNRDLSGVELYELEMMFVQKQAFKWRRREHESPYIGPGEQATFEIEVLGKPGLTSGQVQIDYGIQKNSSAGNQNAFYTRQLHVPVNITVNASVELIRTDCLPYKENLGQENSTTLLSQKRNDQKSNKGAFGLLDEGSDENFILLVDLRNAWPQPLEVYIEICYPQKSAESAKDWNTDHCVEALIQPGHTARLIIPIPRIFISNSRTPIPSLNPAKQRHFNVSGTKVSPEVEMATRESFWYREEILKLLKGRWKNPEQGRSGQIEMRSLRLTPRMVEIIRVEDVGIDLEVSDPQSAVSDNARPMFQNTGSSFDVPTETFFSLETRVTNRTTMPVHLILRLQSSLRHQSHSIALDMSRRIAWNGLSQQVLPPLGAGETTEISTGFCVLCRGDFEVGATVEEIKVPDSPADSDQLAHEKVKMDTLAMDRRRRVWHTRNPCLITAR